jgi:fucose 4-O-acetylase-like acetyltransferase
MNKSPVPNALKNWFIVHFIIDIVFAVPLFFIPAAFLSFFGWQTIDPFATRIVAAALFGIGIESFLGRNAAIQTYKNMLNLKIIWSGVTIAGIGLTILQSPNPASFGQWFLLAVFIGFHCLWIYWRKKISRYK